MSANVQNVPMKRNVDPYSQAEIGRRLKLLRDALGHTQATMGTLAGVTNKAWQNYEKGYRKIEINAVARLRGSLGVTSEWVYFGNIANMPADLLEKLQLETKNNARKRR